jgi:hypothetical protein
MVRTNFIFSPCSLSVPVFDDALNCEGKNFCSSNNIEWGCVWSECWNSGVIGTREQIEMVEDYISKLEKNN